MAFGTWNFQQKPTGMWKHVLSVPTHLFRWHLGFLMGERILQITHVGRTSGRVYRTAVEVVEHDRQSGEYIVCSGTGPGADWYRNITAHPATEVQVKNRRWRPAQRLLSQREAAERFARYESRHRRTSRMLLRAMGEQYDGTDQGRIAMMGDIPMVAFSDTAR